MKINTNYLDKFVVYFIYLTPVILALGTFSTNVYQAVIAIHGAIIFIKNKNKMNICYTILFFLFLYSFFLTAYNGNYFFLKNTIFFLKIIFFCESFRFLFEHKKITINNLFFIFFLFLLVYIFDTYYQYFFEKNIFGFPIEPINKTRLTSFFYEEYVIGGFLFKIFFPILIILTLSANEKINRFLYTSIFVIYCSAIFITGERASFLFIFVYLFLSFLFIKKLRIKIFILMSLIIVTFSIMLFLSTLLKERYVDQTLQTTLRLHKANSFQNKFLDNHYAATFLTGFEIWKKNIFFGSGLRSYRIYSCNDKALMEKIKNVSNHGNLICNTHPHNVILEILDDIGLFGLLLVCFLFVCIGKIIIKMRNNWFDNKIAIFFGIQIFTLFWPLITHGSIFSSWNGSFILFNCAMFYAAKKIKLE
jgi:O-antigen ligase